jgi:DNA-binding NarL/FixJ family response regulator
LSIARGALVNNRATTTVEAADPSYLCGVTIRVVLAEDAYIVREGLRRVVESTPGLELVAVCTDLESLRKAVLTHTPDVLVTDIRMPPTGTDEGIRAAEELRESSPRTGVVVLSQHSQPEYALALLARGSAGRAYLLKDRVADMDQLVNAVREVARGGSVIDPKVVEGLVEARARKPSRLDDLTPREREVLAHVAQGESNAAIARALFVTERAIEKHINSIFSKLELSEGEDINRRVRAALVFLAEV